MFCYSRADRVENLGYGIFCVRNKMGKIWTATYVQGSIIELYSLNNMLTTFCAINVSQKSCKINTANSWNEGLN